MKNKKVFASCLFMIMYFVLHVALIIFGIKSIYENRITLINAFQVYCTYKSSRIFFNLLFMSLFIHLMGSIAGSIIKEENEEKEDGEDE